jgi:DNA invertase Pin-like site-specific DNA recombinase
MVRVAVYLRVSTIDQSTDLQRLEVEQYLKLRGWTAINFFEDKASGTNDNRVQFQEMMKQAKARKFDVLVCWKLDRLFRSMKHLVVTLGELQELNIQFISLKDQIDLTTSSGRLMMHLIAAFAEFEADLIKERVNAGLRNAKAKGKILGRPRVINPNVVVSLRQKGLSLSEIARQIGASKSSVSKTLTALGFANPLIKPNKTGFGES